MKRIAHITNGYISNVSLASDDAELKPGTMLEAEAIAQGFIWAPVSSVKTWSSAQDFMAEFSMAEKTAISKSTDDTVAALRLELATWRAALVADDPRVVAGVNKLLELDIINADRKTQILGSA